jgi:hypothetical protein
MKWTDTLSNLPGAIIWARMATQILAAKSTQTRIRRPALHPSSIVRKGGTDAHLTRARCRHARLHALPWSPLR